MNRRKLLIICAVLGSVLIATFPQIYWSKPISGIVVDDISEEPIEGAIVVIAWRRKTGWFHSTDNGVFNVKETTTDNKGEFEIHWYTPKLRYLFDTVPDYDPTIFIVEKDRKLKTYTNGIDNRRSYFNPILTSKWSGSVLKAGPKYSNDIEDYLGSFQSLTFFLNDLFRHNPCSWRKIEQLVNAIYRVEEYARRNNYPYEICPCGKSVAYDCGAQEYLDALK